MNVAVLGAGGFLGRNVVRELSLIADCQVTAVTSRTVSILGASSMVEPSDLNNHVPGLSAIVNCAVSYGRNSPLSAYEANIAWPLSIIRLAASREIPFLNINSFYGKYPLATYLPLRTYSLTKALLPVLGRQVFQEQCGDESKFMDISLEHAYGPGDSVEKFIPWLLAQMKNQVKEIKLTDGVQLRDFVFVSDAARTIAVATHKLPEIDVLKPLEIGTSKAVPVRRLVEIAASLTDYQGELHFGAVVTPRGEISSSAADPYLRELLGLSYLSLEDGLSETLGKKFR